MSLYSRPSFLQPAICTSSLPALMTFSLVAFSALAVSRSHQYLPSIFLLPCILACAVILWIVRVVLKAVSNSVLDANMASESSEVSLYHSNHIAELSRPIAHSLPRRPFPLSAPTLARLRRPSSSEKTLIPSTKEVPPDEALLRRSEHMSTNIYHPGSCGYRRCVDPS
ncbi:hypothetical protein BDZ89DRAFT_1083267 [Hymenopellis radicata]|nr:hypothetical protein BDZ89DRAFT_1083267 [Hymenopellis radicata]